MESQTGFIIRHVKGETCPELVCELCGELIEDIGMAGVAWNRSTGDENGLGQKVAIFCKSNNCLQKVSGHFPYWMEMQHYLIWLLRNSGVKTEKRLRDAWNSVHRAA